VTPPGAAAEAVRRVDLAGQRFGQLRAAALVDRTHGHPRWLCLCDCGTASVVSRRDLTIGHTTSCGCARRQRGAGNPNWTASAVGYHGTHKRLGPIAGRPCVDCTRPAHHWSLRATTPPERLRTVSAGKNCGRRFSTEATDYEPRCVRCHRLHDGQVGEGLSFAKLTEARVREARALYRPGIRGHGIAALAARFGVHRRTMWSAVNGNTWTHVA
jgi:hypothetical protein